MLQSTAPLDEKTKICIWGLRMHEHNFTHNKQHGVDQACQSEGPPRAIWVTYVLSWGTYTTTNWSHLIKIIAEYFYYLHLETYSVHSWMQSNVVWQKKEKKTKF